MKILLLFIVAFSIDLFARMNPFEPTNIFNEQKSEYYKIAEKKKAEKLKEKKETLLIEQKQKLDELAKKKKLEKIAKMKSIIVKTKIKKTKQNESFKILSFVNIEIIDGVLIIKVDKKYKLFNEDILKKQNKFLFDFRGNISFYTVRKMIKNKNFKSLAVGTHRKNNFFRIVIDLEDDMVKYKENIYSKKGMITIQKINK